MLGRPDILRRLREEMPLLREQFGVRSLALFGSFARAEEQPSSDVDVLASFERTPSLIQLLRVENHLADLLKRPVDLVLEEGLKPEAGHAIRQERVLV